MEMKMELKPWQKVFGEEFNIEKGYRLFVYQQEGKGIIIGTNVDDPMWKEENIRKKAEKRQKLLNRREKRKNALKIAKIEVEERLTRRYNKGLKKVVDKKIDRETKAKARLIARKIALDKESVRLGKEINK